MPVMVFDGVVVPNKMVLPLAPLTPFVPAVPCGPCGPVAIENTCAQAPEVFW